MASEMITGLCHEFTKKEIWFKHYIIEYTKDGEEKYFPVKIINGKAIIYYIWNGTNAYCLWEWGANTTGYKIYTTKNKRSDYVVLKIYGKRKRYHIYSINGNNIPDIFKEKAGYHLGIGEC